MEIKELEIKLVEREIRPTAMRLLVLEALYNRKTAISLSELEIVLGKSDRVTLFRTLKTFQGNGLVHNIDDGTGSPNMHYVKTAVSVFSKGIYMCISIAGFVEKPSVCPNTKSLKSICLPTSMVKKPIWW